MSSNHRDELTNAYLTFMHKHEFKPGDVVTWKPNMQYKRADGPFVVMEVLETAILDNARESGSLYFRDRLDIVLGHFDIDGDFLCYYYDSRRFQPIKD